MATPSSLIEVGTGLLICPLAFSESEYEQRLKSVRQIMKQGDLDVFISFTPENIYYLTGHDTPGYYYLQACVVTHDNLPIVFTRKIESFNTLGRSWARMACPYTDTQNPVDVLTSLLNELECKKIVIGLESNAWFITVDQYLSLSRNIERTCRVDDASGLIEELRMIKSDEELKYIREAGKICSAAMRVAFETSHEGTTENDVASKTVAELIKNGGEHAGLPPFITSGPRTTLVHSTWSGRTLCKGDVLTYELPGVRARYCAALYRTGIVGNPSKEIRNGANVIIETLNELLDAIRPGKPINEVHQVSLDVFKRNNFSASRRSAYALGINYPPDWGEGHIVSFTEKETRPLQAGMVFHVGTGVFEYPRYLLGITESVIITDTGYEVVTDFPRELIKC